MAGAEGWGQGRVKWTGIKAEFGAEVGVSKKTGQLFCLQVTDAERKGIKKN